MFQKIMFSYANFSVVASGRIYILSVDYNRYVIGYLCSEGLGKCKYIYWKN